MWDWIVRILTEILRAIHGVVGDWGLAVIVLTIIVFILVMPIQNKATVSSARMQVLQPKLNELQKKYGNDKVRLNEEMQKFYSENEFNPIGGCLPVLLQMPIFFGLFSVTKEVPKDASLFNLLPSISSSAAQMFKSSGIGGSWGYILLVALFGALTFISTLISLKSTPQEQRKQTLIMSIAMTIMLTVTGWSLPAAVLLYYDTSAALRAIQTKFVTQKVIEETKAKEVERLANKPKEIEVNVVRKQSKNRNHKKH